MIAALCKSAPFAANEDFVCLTFAVACHENPDQV
jgi:hypothetical protein